MRKITNYGMTHQRSLESIRKALYLQVGDSHAETVTDDELRADIMEYVVAEAREQGDKRKRSTIERAYAAECVEIFEIAKFWIEEALEYRRESNEALASSDYDPSEDDERWLREMCNTDDLEELLRAERED